MMTEFPIMAYLGVHNNPNKEENYQQFKDCGFNLSLWRFKNHDDETHSGFLEACNFAAKHGIGIIACTDDMYWKPAEMAKAMKDVEGFYGYYIVDEPNVKQMKEFQDKYIAPILSSDTTHAVYMNLLPHYDDLMQESWGCNTYGEYLEASKVMDYTQVSFDFYPVTKDGLRRDTWYQNLQEIADFSKKINKPFWGFILSVPHICYPQPELSHLRIQAYTNLAYGAQGLEYFTYQTPVNDPDYDFHNGPIDVDYETKTDTWHLVKAMNKELKKALPIFHGATNFKVVRTKPCLWWSKASCKDLPEDVTYLSVNSRTGCLVSTFQNNGQEYLVVVNSDHEEEVRLSFYSSHYVHIKKENLEREEAGVFYSLGPGDIQIFMHED